MNYSRCMSCPQCPDDLLHNGQCLKWIQPSLALQQRRERLTLKKLRCQKIDFSTRVPLRIDRRNVFLEVERPANVGMCNAASQLNLLFEPEDRCRVGGYLGTNGL